HGAARVALADHLLLLPGRHRWRRLLPRRADGPLRRPAAAPAGAARLSRRVPADRGVRPAADRRPPTPAALLAHDAAVRDAAADAQGVVADVARLVGAAALRLLRVPGLPGRAGRGRAVALARAGAPAPARTPRPRGGDAGRRSRLLRRRLHGRATHRHQPPDLGRYHSPRPRV